jgi:hypothetical protein
MPDSTDPIIDLRDRRLAELVAGLTGCGPDGALHAVREQGGTHDALALVAGAMVTLDQPEPEGFRVAGYLRDDLRAGRPLPRRRPTGRAAPADR